MTLFPVAYASAGAGAANDSGFSFLIMMAGFALVFYFLIWRPQNQRQKEIRQLLEQLKKGDEVVTSGGLLGKITKISGDFVTVSLNEQMDVTIQKSAITSTLPKGTLKSI